MSSCDQFDSSDWVNNRNSIIIPPHIPWRSEFICDLLYVMAREDGINGESDGKRFGNVNYFSDRGMIGTNDAQMTSTFFSILIYIHSFIYPFLFSHSFHS